MSLYQRRDTEAIADLYLMHVEAMTAEGLHSKSAIAAELAWRDDEIGRLKVAESERRRMVVKMMALQALVEHLLAKCAAANIDVAKERERLAKVYGQQ